MEKKRKKPSKLRDTAERTRKPNVTSPEISLVYLLSPPLQARQHSPPPRSDSAVEHRPGRVSTIVQPPGIGRFYTLLTVVRVIFCNSNPGTYR